MNGEIFPALNVTGRGKQYSFSPTVEGPLYRQYKPPARDLIPLPKAVVYLLMAVLVVVGVAYAIVGHLIKDLAIDITECVLGPSGDEDKEKDKKPQCTASSHPPSAHPFAHNAFHVWDQDDVVISLPHEERDSPQISPMMMASAIPYIPSFFPHLHSPTSHSSPAFSNSPGPVRESSITREL